MNHAMFAWLPLAFASCLSGLSSISVAQKVESAHQHPQDTSASILIDRIEITGDAKISAIDLAKNLEIPVGVRMSPSEASDLLSEGDRRLRASGKYKDDLTLKLEKGAHYPHFILKAFLNEVDDWYTGFDGHYLRGPSDFFNSLDAKSLQNSGDVEAYIGTRDYQGTGLAFDLELMGGYSKTRSDYEQGKYQYELSFNSLTASVIGNHFLNGHLYTGVVSRVFGIQSWFLSEGDHTTKSDGKTYRYISSDSTKSQSFYATLEPILGVRISKLQLGGKAGRSLSRTIKERSNHDRSLYIDGVPAPSMIGYSSQYDDDHYTFNNAVEFTFAWSDKSRLTVIEPGLDLHATWSRSYGNDYTDAPRWVAHAEYSYLLAKQFAATLISDGEWEIRNDSTYQAKVRRIIDLGTRLDFVTESKIIFFGEFYRVGGKRSELSYNATESGYTLKNRINAGIKYASPDMIYSLTAGYGAPLAGDNFIGPSMDSVYKRLGVR